MNPCCGWSLQRGTKVIANLQWVFSIIVVVFVSVNLVLGGGILPSWISAIQNNQKRVWDENWGAVFGQAENAQILRDVMWRAAEGEAEDGPILRDEMWRAAEGEAEDGPILRDEIVFRAVFGEAADVQILRDEIWRAAEEEAEGRVVSGKVIAGATGSFVTTVGIVIIVLGILFMILSAFLASGANKRNRTRCMIWFVAHAIFFVLGWLGTFAVIFSRGGKKTFRFEGFLEGNRKVSAIAGSIIWNLINCYFFWVVWAFMSEIKKKGVEVEFQIPRVEIRGPKTWA